MKQSIVFFCAALLIVSCSVKEEEKSCEVIDFTPFQKDEVSDDITQYIEDVELIPFEVSDSCLVGHYTDLYVEEDRVIFCEHQMSMQPVKIFGRDGRFIKSVNIGQGPGEVSRVYAVAVDSKMKQILIRHPGQIMYLDFNGEFVKNDKVDFHFSSFAVCGEELVFKTSYHQKNEELGENGGYKAFVTDREYNVKNVNQKIDSELLWRVSSPMERLSDYVSYVNVLEDTIYFYKNGEFGKLLELNYQDKIFADGFPDDIVKVSQMLRTVDGYYFTGIYSETETHQYLELANDYQKVRVCVYRDKESGVVRGRKVPLSEFREAFSLKNCSPLGSYKDYFYITIEPGEVETQLEVLESFLSEEEKNILKGITEDSNPVVLMYKLKDF